MCPLAREQKNDILDAAQRPSLMALEPDAIRFSTQPALGGEAIVIELSPSSGRSADVSVFLLYGHLGVGWEIRAARHFTLSAGDYQVLSAMIDRDLAGSPYVEESDVIVLCTDGPGYLTERVRDGRELSLTGFCASGQDEIHPNRKIARRLRDVLCRNGAARFVRALYTADRPGC